MKAKSQSSKSVTDDIKQVLLSVLGVVSRFFSVGFLFYKQSKTRIKLIQDVFTDHQNKFLGAERCKRYMKIEVISLA